MKLIPQSHDIQNASVLGTDLNGSTIQNLSGSQGFSQQLSRASDRFDASCSEIGKLRPFVVGDQGVAASDVQEKTHVASHRSIGPRMTCRLAASIVPGQAPPTDFGAVQAESGDLWEGRAPVADIVEARCEETARTRFRFSDKLLGSYRNECSGRG